MAEDTQDTSSIKEIDEIVDLSIDNVDLTNADLENISSNNPLHVQHNNFMENIYSADLVLSSLPIQGNNQVEVNDDSCNDNSIVSEMLSQLHLVDLTDNSNDITLNSNIECQSQCQLSDNLCFKCQTESNKKDLSQLLKTLDFFDEALVESHSLLEESSQWMNNAPVVCGAQYSRLDLKDDMRETINEFDTKLLELGDMNETELKIVDDFIFTDLEISSGSTDKKTINSLPNEVMFKIFSYFNLRELCQYISPVCSLWHNLSKDPSHWRQIFAADFDDVCDNLLIDMISAWCKFVKLLELNRRSNLTLNEFKNIFEHVPLLETLSLAFCTQTNKLILSLLPLYCKSLTSINLEGCTQVTDECFYCFVGLPLTSISVSHCDQLSDEGIIFIANNFKHLVEINVDGIQWITEDSISCLVQKHNTTLQRIYLDGENLTDHSVALLATCSDLMVLSFSFCTNLSHESILMLTNCSNLHHLQLRKGANFTNQSLLDYLKNMTEKQATNFKFLNLAECTEISDECLFYIAEKFPNLEHLDLSWCWEVSDDGLAFIIESCHKLKKLFLRGLHELYGIPFTKISKHLPNLTFLDLSQCNKVQDELIESVVGKMKNLIVYNYYGDIVVNSKHRHAHLVT